MDNLTENNRLIAHFMDFQHDDETLLSYLNGEPTLDIEDLDYLTSWDWLMPVVEKIREVVSYDRDKFGTTVNICGNYTRIRSESYGSKKEHSTTYFNKKVVSNNQCDTLANTYKAVVEFIKWHNK